MDTNICSSSSKYLQLDEYVIKAQNGDLAMRDYVVEKYINVAKKESRKYYKWKNGLETDDLIQEGSLGILKAIDKFDINKKVPFDFHCKKWINAYMHNSIYERGRVIRTPVNKARKISKLEKQLNDSNKNMAELNVSEIAQATNLDINEVQKLVCNKVTTFSINQNINENTENELEVFLQTTDKTPYEEIERKETLELIYTYIDNYLDKDDQFIIKNYYSIFSENDTTLTLEEIGNAINMSKQGISARKNRILQKIKEFIKNDGNIDNHI